MPIYVTNEDHKHVINETVNSVLEHSKGAEFIIVDDRSPIDVSYLKKYATMWVEHSENRGVAPSWNSGIRFSSDDYIAIINDDIVVPENWLQDIAKCFEVEKCGVASPRVEHLPDPKSGIAEKITWYPGSCFMLSKDVIDDVGLFDEQFVPFNCEDVDYWHRLREKGYKMMRNFDVFVEHKEGKTVKQFDYNAVNNKNVERLIKKWGSDIRKEYYD